MTNATDMSTPVTRGELREEFRQFKQELKQELQQELQQTLQQALAPLATKTALEIWGGALLARIESGEQRLVERIDRTERQLHAELARHTKAIYESMSIQISASAEKYDDLPGRVNHLELAVFGHKQR